MMSDMWFGPYTPPPRGFPVLKGPKGIELTVRERDGECFLFMLNHNKRRVSVPLHGFTGRDLITNEHVARWFKLAPFGARVIRLSKPLNAR